MLTDEELIYIFQIIQFIIIFGQYIPQIVKTYKVKSVKEISVTSWLSKLAYTLLSITMLVYANNSFIIVLSQILNLFFTVVILYQLFYYSKNK